MLATFTLPSTIAVDVRVNHQLYFIGYYIPIRLSLKILFNCYKSTRLSLKNYLIAINPPDYRLKIQLIAINPANHRYKIYSVPINPPGYRPPDHLAELGLLFLSDYRIRNLFNYYYFFIDRFELSSHYISY